MTATNGLLRAVVFDWAGTVVDHGSLAPMGVFVEAFAEFGVPISIEQARGPMGMAKRPHIAALMALPGVAEAWTKQHGHVPTEADIDAVYDVFVPKNRAVAARYADLIPGVAEVVAALRARGLKIGSTTGYTRDIMAEILPVAAKQGFAPDCLVCTGDTPDGRPTPFMLWKALTELGVYPATLAVKVDDTEVGIAEGVNAGAWTVGVSVTGNVFGYTLAETQALPPDVFRTKRAEASAKLSAAGAHYVVSGVADLLPVIAQIEGRLRRGERP
ncbi:phosphonoacetaldehyde hydrolase [Mesorhizobium sp. B1-1-8]|uniref:phosphonoacetaldehyde hydrolase n=1 Tax=Mesorhizobium sp. B1-1-8 TaxID=2589976 RepID=UPI00112E2335|nr:phosphonoacetaldehyde hydrolase [Mesorhizobium sp. B1-1-8]UCI05763.1 phosphonoacetaldehyde hydrolase [Mesorhizobium sp. B1-1-8]